MKVRRGGRRGVRFIGRREFLLAGSVDTREAAERERSSLERAWSVVRIRAHRLGFRLWVHGAR